MAVARQGRSITMSANADAIGIGNIFFLNGANFQGTGLTAGENLKLTDTNGAIIFDYIVSGTSDNADLMNGRIPTCGYHGLTLAGPSGAWVLTLMLE